MTLDLSRLRAAYEKAKADLLAERTLGGWWVGELSSSALSTATAVSALSVVKASGGRQPPVDDVSSFAPDFLTSLISRGVAYLTTQQNSDGGFGDTDLSHSNIATSMLVVAALHLADVAAEHADLLSRANAYIDGQGRLEGLRKRYGIDKTFVVPIMTNCAIAGLLDWREIDPLPFELACVPQSWYRFVGMPVVSYAIPALVAIGQAVYFHSPPWNPISRFVRWLSITRSLKVLRRMQPDSGGYLEATPLTSFVVMSLASCGSHSCGPLAPQAESLPADAGSPGYRSRSERTTPERTSEIADEVIREGVKFLANSIRPDGSWPIDTNLATWNTTLAINALAGAGEDVAELLMPRKGAASAVGNALRGVPRPALDAQPAEPGMPRRAFPTEEQSQPSNVLDWLLSCQHLKRHPFTGADPGGFGWSDLAGAVPDADDTPGAVLAICGNWNPNHNSDSSTAEHKLASATIAMHWLLKLQNRDRGWPTFCRGWGRLPFDRSGTDLTAHTVRASHAWEDAFLKDDTGFKLAGSLLSDFLKIKVARARQRGLGFIQRTQHSDGSWSPLWFGNQDRPDEDNPVYGTAKVLMAYRDLGLMDSPEAKRGVAWLVANQNADGGWGSGVWGKAAALQIAKCELQTAKYEKEPTISNLQFAVTNLQSSVEETALAVEALLAACPPVAELRNATEGVPYSAVARGLAWLIDRVEGGQHRQPAPIGFYFAKLWYYEKLYPLTFTVAALGRACRQFIQPAQTAAQSSPPTDRAP